MKKILFAVLALLVSVGLANLAVAEAYSVHDSSDGGYEVGIEYFKLLKKIEKPPNDINPKLTRAEVLKVFESSQKGEKYLHKGANPRKTILFSAIPPKVEKLNEEYELSILENGKWGWKLLQPRETLNSPQFFYVCMAVFFLGMLCISISERLWLRGIKRLLFFYFVILIGGCVMLFNPTNNIAYVLYLIAFVAAVTMLLPDKPSKKAVFIFLIGSLCCLWGGMPIFIIFSIAKKSDPNLLLKQSMALIGASIITAFFIGELGYQIKKRLYKVNAMLTEIPNHEDS